MVAYRKMWDLKMTDQPSEAQLRERAKWSSDASADAIQFGIMPHVVTASQGDRNWHGDRLASQKATIPPAYVAAHQIAIGASLPKLRIPHDYTLSNAPIEARVKALETALAVLHDRIAVQENAWRGLFAVETPEKSDSGPHVVIAKAVPDQPPAPEAPIHAAIRASSEPKPMVGPMGSPQVK